MLNLTSSDALTLFIMVSIFGVAALLLGVTVGTLKNEVSVLKGMLEKESRDRRNEGARMRDIVERILLKGDHDV